MKAPDANILSSSFEILKDERLWRPAVAVGLLALTLLWLCILRKPDSPPSKWTMAVAGPYRFELAYDDTLAPIKSTTTPEGDLLSVNVKADTAAVFAMRKFLWHGPIEIIADNFPDRIFLGSLNFYEHAVATEKNKKDTAIHAVIRIMNPEKLLNVGMRVRSAVLLDTSSHAVFLPDSAVFEMDGEAIVFPRSDWPQPRLVQVGPKNGINIMIAEGIKAEEKVALAPPQNLMHVQRLSPNTYGKLLSESRQRAMQLFVERLNRDEYQGRSDSFVAASKEARASSKNFEVSTALADCTAAIDQMLSEDSSRAITIGRVRIGPGEGGELAPVPPEMLKEMKPGEKISVSIPAQSDTSADTLHARSRQIENDSSKASQEPPDEH